MRKLVEVAKLYYNVNIRYEIENGETLKLIIRCLFLLLFIVGLAMISLMANLSWIDGEQLYFYILLFIFSISQYISHLVKSEFNYFYIRRFPFKFYEALASRLLYRNLDLLVISCNFIGLIILCLKFKLTFPLILNYFLYVVIIQILTEILNVVGTKLYVNKQLYYFVISFILVLLIVSTYFNLFLPTYLIYSLIHPSFINTLLLFGIVILSVCIYKVVYTVDFRLKPAKGITTNISFIFEFLVNKFSFIDHQFRYLIAKDLILMLRTKKHVFIYCFLLCITFMSKDVGVESSVFYNLLIAFPVQICINSFSLDNKGVISIFQTNVDRKKVIMSKNVVSGFLILVLYILFSVIFILMGRATIINTSKLFLFVVPALLILLPLSNYLSVTFPLKESNAGVTFGAFNIKSILIYSVVSILVLTVFTVLTYFYKNKIFIYVLIASTGFGYLFYMYSLEKIVKKLNITEKQFITKLLFTRG